MGRRKKPIPGKRRTREHIIADVSVNYVERYLLRCGYSVQWSDGADYGLDLFVTTFDESGNVEHGDIRFQIKATDHLAVSDDGKMVSLTIGIADLKFWIEELLPVLLILYDAQRERAYWLHVQKYAEDKEIVIDDVESDSVRIRIPVANRLTERAVRRFREWKNVAQANLRRSSDG